MGGELSERADVPVKTGESAGSEESLRYISDGVIVHATMRMPVQAKGKGRHPAAVLVHGWGSTRDDLGGFRQLAEALVGRGIASLRMDLRGCGASGLRGDIHPHSEWINDVFHAVSYLISDGRLDPERIGLVGMSVGGGTVVVAGALDRRVRCVAALAPVADGLWWLENLWSRRSPTDWQALMERVAEDRLGRVRGRPSQLRPVTELLGKTGKAAEERERRAEIYPDLVREASLSSIDSLLSFKPRVYAPLVAPTPLLLIHSQTDESVPVRHSLELFEKASDPKELEIIEQSPHCFWLGQASDRVIARTADWMESHLLG